MRDKELSKFCEKMDELLPKVTREFARRSQNELTRGKITIPQMVILEFLNKKGECIMSELANYLAITLSAVTGLIDRMLRLNLVKRARSQKDRRIVKIGMTQKGKSAIENILRQRRNMLIDIFKNFTKTERKQYLKAIEKIHRILKRTERQ